MNPSRSVVHWQTGASEATSSAQLSTVLLWSCCWETSAVLLWTTVLTGCLSKYQSSHRLWGNSHTSLWVRCFLYRGLNAGKSPPSEGTMENKPGSSRNSLFTHPSVLDFFSGNSKYDSRMIGILYTKAKSPLLYHSKLCLSSQCQLFLNRYNLIIVTIRRGDIR